MSGITFQLVEVVEFTGGGREGSFAPEQAASQTEAH